MEDDTPIIYGLEFQTRALTSQVAETDIVKFFVGTQSLKFDNQVHLLEYDEEINQVSKIIYLHNAGEIWHIAASPSNCSLISTCFNQLNKEGRCEMRSAVWQLPSAQTMSDVDDPASSSFPILKLGASFETKPFGNKVINQIWHPTEPCVLASVVNKSLLLWDIAEGKSQASLISNAQADSKSDFSSLRWNPHHNSCVVAGGLGTDIKSWDLRTMSPAWTIDKAHGQLVREIDFNPNKQYYIASCGDDCLIKFWDCRNPKLPVLVQANHSHWVWCIRYNHFHDQLVLSASSDARVVLSRVASISSEPFGHLLEDEENVNPADGIDVEKSNVADGVVAMYEEHEDSVYAAEWSSADPWMFASLSYDGRLVFNKVPRQEKYRILL